MPNPICGRGRVSFKKKRERVSFDVLRSKELIIWCFFFKKISLKTTFYFISLKKKSQKEPLNRWTGRFTGFSNRFIRFLAGSPADRFSDLTGPNR
jgi:hypothetical protein